MKRVLVKLGLFALAIAGLVAANAILFAIVAALDLSLGVPPQVSAIPALAALAAILAFVAMRKGSRAVDRRPVFDPAQSTPVVAPAMFISSIVVRHRQNGRTTGRERRVYSEASF